MNTYLEIMLGETVVAYLKFVSLLPYRDLRRPWKTSVMMASRNLRRKSLE